MDFLLEKDYWGCQKLFHWIGQKILSCFHVKHFEIDPTVPKLDIVKWKGQQFESQTPLVRLGRNFLWDTLELSEVVTIVMAENSFVMPFFLLHIIFLLMNSNI